MKKIIFILIALFILSGAKAQSCLPEGILFETQAQINNFQENYPGCTEIEGDVSISGLEITNLTGLNTLISIGGSLSIYYNSELSSLSGLEGLTSVGGSLIIYSNYELSNLTVLNNLTYLGGDLMLSDNIALTSITGLANIEAGSLNNLSINTNSSLANCEVENICDYLASPNGYVEIYLNADGCNSPTEIADACGISLPCLPHGNYWFYSQEEIDNFQVNYPGCTNLEGNVMILGYSGDITNLNGLSELVSVSGNLHIDACNLTSLAALQNLEFVGGDLNLWSAGTMTSLSGLTNLTSIGGNLSISGNPNLVNLSGLNGLTSLGGLILGYNDALASLTGLGGLTTIGDLGVNNNNALASLTGLAGITTITGNIYISMNQIMTSLSGLENLASIGGSLKISDNYAMASLSGLDNLTSIGDYLSIEYDNALVNLSGMENLASVGGDLSIQHNGAITSLTGLEGLNSIGGSLNIFYNYSLTNISGLGNLEVGTITDLTIAYNSSLSTCDLQWLCDYISDPGGSIDIHHNSPGCGSIIEIATACGGSVPCLPYGNYYFSIQSDIDHFPTAFSSCTHLEGNVTVGGGWNDITNLMGLEGVNSISGNLTIYSTWSLNDLSGLDELHAINGNLVLGSLYDGGTYSLTSLTGLDNLASIGGSVEILNNMSLNSFTGMGSLTSIGGYFSIFDNDSLTSFTGLNNLASIGLNLSIHDNNSLNGLTGLDNLASIGLDLEIYSNSALESLTGLDGLNTINGNLVIGTEDNGGNPSLTSLTGLQGLVSIGGSLEVIKNESLASLTGLEGLTSTGRQLFISENASLVSLSGLDNLTSIGDKLRITYNPDLASLASLENVGSIDGNLEIMSNASLTSLTGLDNIDEATVEDLFIYYNSSLSTCNVQSICDYLASPNGIYAIHSNDQGCDSEEEVEAICASGLEDNTGGLNFSILPNPSSNQFTFAFITEQPVPVRLEIFNSLGQLVAVILDENMLHGNHQVTWNAEGLPPGIYLYRILAGRQASSGKIMLVR